MRVLGLFFYFILVVAASGQVLQDKADAPTGTRQFRSESYVPYIFEPYQADYVYRGRLFGVPLNFLSARTRIIEMADEWEETQSIRLDFLDLFPDKKGDKEDYREIEITSNIDLKTGLLKQLRATISNKPQVKMVVDFSEKGRITATATDGKRTEQRVYPALDNIYPCSFSNAFLSYLPLNDSFAGTFTCVDINSEDLNKDSLRFTQRTLKVIGSETVSVEGGRFDCFVLSDNSDELRFDKNGKEISTRKRGRGEFDEDKFWANTFSKLWIDKRSRKVVKAEADLKIGEMTVELRRSSRPL